MSGLNSGLHHLIQFHPNIYYSSDIVDTGWWFGTFFIFPYIGNVIIPIDVHIFQRGGPTTNQILTWFFVWHAIFRCFSKSWGVLLLDIPAGVFVERWDFPTVGWLEKKIINQRNCVGDHSVNSINATEKSRSHCRSTHGTYFLSWWILCKNHAVVAMVGCLVFAQVGLCLVVLMLIEAPRGTPAPSSGLWPWDLLRQIFLNEYVMLFSNPWVVGTEAHGCARGSVKNIREKYMEKSYMIISISIIIITITINHNYYCYCYQYCLLLLSLRFIEIYT